MTEPLIRIRRGTPDDVEVAALTSALLAVLDRAGSEPPAPQPAPWTRDGWAAPHAWTTT